MYGLLWSSGGRGLASLVPSLLFRIPATRELSSFLQFLLEWLFQNCRSLTHFLPPVVITPLHHSLYAYFGRENVALGGFAKFVKESSDKESKFWRSITDVERVRLQSIVTPLTEFHDGSTTPGKAFPFSL